MGMLHYLCYLAYGEVLLERWGDIEMYNWDGQTLLLVASLQHGVCSEVPLFCSNFSSMSSSTNYYSNHTVVFIRLTARRLYGWNSNSSSLTYRAKSLIVSEKSYLNHRGPKILPSGKLD
jgi:hypothetical protein